MKKFFKSLTCKLGLAVFLVTAIVLAGLGTFYTISSALEIDSAYLLEARFLVI